MLAIAGIKAQASGRLPPLRALPGRRKAVCCILTSAGQKIALLLAYSSNKPHAIKHGEGGFRAEGNHNPA